MTQRADDSEQGAGAAATPPEGAPAFEQGSGDPTVGGASAGEEGRPIGFSATVGGAPPGTTDDPEEAAEIAAGPAEGPAGH